MEEDGGGKQKALDEHALAELALVKAKENDELAAWKDWEVEMRQAEMEKANEVEEESEIGISNEAAEMDEEDEAEEEEELGKSSGAVVMFKGCRTGTKV